MAARKKKPEQTAIPGTEKVVHKDVTKCAQELYDVRAERMALSEEEGKLSAKLLDLMKKHAVTKYDDGEITVTVVAVDEKVKVKKKRANDE